jgi:hypothetical protein
VEVQKKALGFSPWQTTPGEDSNSDFANFRREGKV